MRMRMDERTHSYINIGHFHLGPLLHQAGQMGGGRTKLFPGGRSLPDHLGSSTQKAPGLAEDSNGLGEQGEDISEGLFGGNKKGRAESREPSHKQERLLAEATPRLYSDLFCS